MISHTQCMTSCTLYYKHRSVIFGIIGTPKDISFISDERAKNYIQSFGTIDKKPFQKLFDVLPAEVEDFLEKVLVFNPT